MTSTPNRIAAVADAKADALHRSAMVARRRATAAAAARRQASARAWVKAAR